MTRNAQPAYLHRQLRRGLRRERERVGLTQLAVAQKMDWSPSKILRIENGHTPAATSDVRALLALYGVTGESRVTELLNLARLARGSSAVDEYAAVLSRQMMDWIEYEASAAVIRWLEVNLVPGVLQSPRYIRAVMNTFRPFQPDETPEERRETVEERVRARMRRNELLLTTDGPQIDAIIDESALHRGVGAADEVMIEQIERLKRLNTVGRAARGESVGDDLNPRISIQVVPFALGVYPLMRGPFELLIFEDEDSLVYLENREYDDVIRDDIGATKSYFDAFVDFSEQLPPAEATNDYLDHIVAIASATRAVGQPHLA